MHTIQCTVWCMVYGVWCMVCGVWCVVCGVWCMVYGVWCMVYGVWCVVYGVWCMAYGVRCMVYGVWCMVCGVQHPLTARTSITGARNAHMVTSLLIQQLHGMLHYLITRHIRYVLYIQSTLASTKHTHYVQSTLTMYKAHSLCTKHTH